MAERAFLRRVKIIIGVPQIDTAGYVYQEDVQQTGGINLGRVVNVPATSVPAGKVINLSNVAPNPSRAFYFKLESTRGGTEGGSANEKSVVELQNLNEDTLELLHQPNAKVMVYLGYEGTSLDLYYTGDIYDIQPSGFGQGDITYRITCKDGFLDNNDPVGGLDKDFAQVPVVCGLAETAKFILPIFYPYGAIKNIYFIEGSTNLNTI